MELKSRDIVSLAGFNRKQKTALRKPPSAEKICKKHDGTKEISYLEGWYVIAEANKIFGADMWDRITLNTQCVWQGSSNGQASCTYTARVRVCVRAGAYTLVREGSGAGQGSGRNPGEAHGNALKAAETDATKRALSTLGAPFGLSLYEGEVKVPPTSCADFKPFDSASSEQPSKMRESTPSEIHQGQGTPSGKLLWFLRDATGQVVNSYRDAVICCTYFRKAIEGAQSTIELEAIFAANRRFLSRLMHEKPELRSTQDQHYASILTALYQARLKRLSLAEQANSTPSELMHQYERAD